MTLNLTLPIAQHTDFTPRIAVFGVGGGGTNAVNNMIAMGLDGVEFVVANTDAQSLIHSKAERRVQLGPHLTQGLGAGAKPEIGRAAAEEATEELLRHLEGCHMVFVTAGMGGGTGTGAAPVIARLARERGVLTVGVVTRPFDFEGPKRKRASEAGIEELQSVVDTLIIIPNQNLFRLANEKTTFADAFRMADNVLYMGVRGVTDLMTQSGLVNLDFADIKTVMAEMGKAMMGTGESDGEDRAVKAAESAISNPLLEDTSMRGARGVLINITGGLDMTLFEVDEAVNRIGREVDGDANIIFGSSCDEAMNGRIRVSVVATGIDVAHDAVAKAEAAREGLTVLTGGRGARVATVAPAAAPVAGGAPATGGTPLRRPMGGPAAVLRAAATPAAAEEPQVAAAPAVANAAAVVLGPAAVPDPVPEARPAPVHAPAAPAGRGLRSLFGAVTGRSNGLMRRPLPEAAPPPAPVLVRNEEPPPLARPRAAPPEEVALDIPAFLRRQAN